MRKILPFLVVGILVLSGLGAVAGTEEEKVKIFSEKIIISQPIVSDSQNYVSLELTESTAESWVENKPAMPVITKTFTFPFGTIIEEVNVAFTDFKDIEISKPLAPSPKVLMKSEVVSNNVEKSKIMTYSDIDVYPKERYAYRTGAGLKDKDHVVYLTISLYPEQYFPQQNLVTHAGNARIDVKYTLPAEPVIFGDTYDFLIIAPANFYSALQPLVDHKNNLNPPIRTKLVSLADIPSGVGVDTQEDIKYFIKEKIEEWGIIYLLLVGAGVEGEEIFPVRNAWVASAPYEDYFPSDLYYADIYDGTGGFSNWDVDGDGKYAEYPTDMANVDVIPDVYMGKLPANNAGEVSTVVDKILQYKAHNKMTRKILQTGGDSFTGDSISEGEYANEAVLDVLPSGYTTTRLWASHPNPDYDTSELTKANIAKGYRANVDFVDMSGHGNWAVWSTHPPNNEETWVPPETLISPTHGFLYLDFKLYNVNNQYKYPVVMYNACSNSKYSEKPDCLGWRTLTKSGGGGIASFAASGIGYGSQGTSETERVMGWMEVHLFEELIATKTLGDVWNNCVSDYYTTFQSNFQQSDWKTMLEFAMFGDPTLDIDNGDDPKSVPVNVPVLETVLEKLTYRFPLVARFIAQLIAKIK